MRVVTPLNIKKYIKKCEEFTICSEIGDSNIIFTEHAADQITLFHIITKGSLKVSESFSNEFCILTRGVHNMKEFCGKHTTYLSLEPFHIYGFCPTNSYVNWDCTEIKESFICNKRSYLICFDGNPIVNDKTMQRMDYSLLEIGKDYKIDHQNSILCLFSKC
jgi:hypothetical protein